MRSPGQLAIAEGEKRVGVVVTPIDMTAADVNGDGQLDIATADKGAGGSLSIYLGRGDGSFAPAIGVVVGGSLTAVVRADLDGDRAADLLAIDAAAVAPSIVRYDAHPVAPLSPDCNRNSVPDDCEIAAGTLADADGDGLADQCGVAFRRGDANGDGLLDIADPVFTLGHLFAGGEAPSCLDAADSDDSEELEITDAVLSLNFLFAGGTSPPAPHPDCGEDPTEGAMAALGCDEYESCQQ